MSWYALRLGSNPNGKRYGKPIGFMIEEEYDEELPCMFDTEDEVKEAFSDHPMYRAGHVDFIEIED